MGSKKDLGDGRWLLKVSTGERTPTGGYRRVSRTVRGTETTAKKALAKLETEVGEGKHPKRAGRDMTVADVLGRWQESRRSEWSPSTVKSCREECDRLLIPRLGDHLAAKLRPADIEQALRDIGSQGSKRGGPLAASTVHRIASHLGAAYRDAVRLGDLESSPMDRVRSVAVPRVDNTRVTVSDVARALEHGPMWWRTLLRVAVVTGARRGELVALRWSDLDGSALRIASSVVRGDQGTTRRPTTKTGRITVLTLDDTTVAALGAWRIELMQIGLKIGHGWDESWPIFPSIRADGIAIMRPDRVSRVWRENRSRCGLDRVKFHDIRHAVATTMIADGVDPRTVADHLGHASAKMTLDVYAGGTASRSAAAVALLASTLDG